MQVFKQDTNEEIFPYIAYIPEKTARPALLIQLHGAGERGEGGDELDKVLVHGFCKVVTDEMLGNCELVMPQCPKDSFWVAKIESIRKFIDQMVEKFDVDTDRIYLCGLSMGGFGTWYTAMAYPDLFAAIAPCCGGGMAWNCGVLMNMPIWTFHGLEDTVVSPNQTLEMIQGLDGHNPQFQYTLYEGVEHGSWELAFTEPTLKWILEQKKS